MNPLTDELSDEAKRELAAEFAELKKRFGRFRLPQIDVQLVQQLRHIRRGW
jgi:cytochrome c553